MEDPKAAEHPSSVFGNMVSGESVLNWRNWTRKELILGGITLFSLFLMFLLAGLLGVANNRTSPPEACKTSTCLEAAAYITFTMNNTADPCTDFYQYACGSYATTRPVKRDYTQRTTSGDLYYKNRDKLEDLMEATYSQGSEWASEQKLKDLYTSCIDDFSTEQKLGQPFIDNMLTQSQMHGWYVFTGSVPPSFDLNHELQTVQSDFRVAALWRTYVGLDWLDTNRDHNAVQIFPARAGRFVSWRYFDPSRRNTRKFQDDYKKYITRLANLLVRDSKLKIADKDTRINTFVKDVFTMCTQISALNKRSKVTRNRYNNASRMSLDDIATRSVSLVDWAAQMSYQYPSLSGSSKVILFKTDYVLGLTSLIANLPTRTRNRIIHNYLVWRLLENYAPYLSAEYVQANRELYFDTYGYRNFPQKRKTCFSYVDRMMPDALGALFVRGHFYDESKNKVVEITKYMKAALSDELKANNWMDDATKKAATEKLGKLKYKLGYPDFMLSSDAVDNIYTKLTINASNFFQNILNMNKFLKTKDQVKLAGGVDKDRWNFDVFDSHIHAAVYFNEISVPSGFLQFPMYAYQFPQYMNFGAMGSRLGFYLTRLIDLQGSKWTTQGAYSRRGWYSNSTLASYGKVKQCVTDYYTNQTQGPYTSPNGTSVMIPIRGTSYVRNAIALATGIKIAYRAYLKWEKDNGVEKVAPAVGLSNEQMFFLAHAQSWCFNRNNRQAYLNAFRGRVEEDIRTNLVLSHLSEFQRAFKCSSGMPMNAPTKCTYY